MRALLLVDIQNDFLPGGALEVPEGDQILPVVKKLLEKEWDFVVASKDWHPEGHSSFGEWPIHCVQGTKGAELAPGLGPIEQVIVKGVDPEYDCYSAFKETGLGDLLRKKGIEELVVAGLATDWCVKETVLDALRLGFSVTVVRDGIRGVNLEPDASKKAIEEMEQKGARFLDLKEI